VREARKKKFSTFLVLYSAKTLKKWFSGRFGYQKNELRSVLRFENQTDLIRSAPKHLKFWPDLDLKVYSPTGTRKLGGTSCCSQLSGNP